MPFIGALCRLKTLEIKLTNDRGLPIPRFGFRPKNKWARWGSAHVFDLIEDLSKLSLESACVYVTAVELPTLDLNPWHHSAPWLPWNITEEDRPTRDVAEGIANKLIGGDRHSARKMKKL